MKHIIVKWAPALIIVIAALASPTAAHETDQYTLPEGRVFADLGPHLNAWAYKAIENGVSKVNARIKQAAQGGGGTSLTSLKSQDTIVRAVNSEFGPAYDVIEGYERVLASPALAKQFPGKIVGYRQQFGNVYQHVHFPLDPRQLFRLWHASTLMAYGTYFGTDKIGHFTDMGLHYYKAYTDARRGGAKHEAALAAAVKVGTSGPLFSERGMVGYLSAGDYSNADLAANYLGLLFYLNLTESVMIDGEMQPPMLTREGDLWTIAPHVRRDSDFFKAFICSHFDEALNPGLFESSMRDALRKAVRERAPAILARRSDHHGNRYPRQYFDAILESHRTYFGQPYGYEGTNSELITIGNTCFESPAPDANVTARDFNGYTSLHHAAASADLATAKRLMQRGANVNAQVRSLERYSSEWGNTPLHLAARSGNVELAEYLIASGANLNAQNDRGQTVLHRALAYPAMVSMLISRGARVNVADNRGETALHWAAVDGQPEAAQLLLKAGANPRLRNNVGATPLHCAASVGSEAAASTLIAAGADVNAANSLGVTPLHLASARRHTAVCELLLSHSANAAAADQFGWTPLHDAAEHGAGEVIELLLSHGGTANVTDAHGTTPLHLAARRQCESACSILLAKGANANARNNLGATPLHEAAFAGNQRIADMLLKHGADHVARNAQGKTPLEVASQFRHVEVITALRSIHSVGRPDGESHEAMGMKR